MATVPVPFSGTKQEALRNFKTHSWWSDFDEAAECMNCAAREYHAAAFYPCGVEPPRKEVNDEDALKPTIARLAITQHIKETQQHDNTHND